MTDDNVGEPIKETIMGFLLESWDLFTLKQREVMIDAANFFEPIETAETTANAGNLPKAIQDEIFEGKRRYLEATNWKPSNTTSTSEERKNAATLALSLFKQAAVASIMSREGSHLPEAPQEHWRWNFERP